MGNANFSNKYPCQLHAAFLTAHFRPPQTEVVIGGLGSWVLGSDFCVFIERKKKKKGTKSVGFK